MFPHAFPKFPFNQLLNMASGGECWLCCFLCISVPFYNKNLSHDIKITCLILSRSPLCCQNTPDLLRHGQEDPCGCAVLSVIRPIAQHPLGLIGCTTRPLWIGLFLHIPPMLDCTGIWGVWMLAQYVGLFVAFFEQFCVV